MFYKVLNLEHTKETEKDFNYLIMNIMHNI
jgi:hypothetical protein